MSRYLRNLLLVYLIVLALAVVSVRPAVAADVGVQVAYLSVGSLNIAGNYDVLPLWEGYHFQRSAFEGDYVGVQLELLKLFEKRRSFVRKWEQADAKAWKRLRAEYRRLRLKQDGTGESDWESDWALALSRNIAEQARLRKRFEEALGDWDARHSVGVEFVVRADARVIRALHLPGAASRLAVR